MYHIAWYKHGKADIPSVAINFQDLFEADPKPEDVDGAVISARKKNGHVVTFLNPISRRLRSL